MRENAKLIIIPNLFGLGRAFFPQYFEWNCHNSRNGWIANDRNGMFPHGDKYINELIDKGKTIDEIYKLLNDKSFISREEVIDNFQFYTNKIKDRDLKCDVKIYDFIMNHYKREQLFSDQGHPTNMVIKEMVRQIRCILKIDDCSYDAEEMNIHEEFVYPCVRDALDLSWNQSTIRNRNCGKKVNKMDFYEYIKEYVWWQQISSV